MYSYAHQTATPRDSFSTKLTLSYLEACNKIFEQGILSHEKVASPDHQVIHNIQEGYQFFIEWLDEIFEQGSVFVYNNTMYIGLAGVCPEIPKGGGGGGHQFERGKVFLRRPIPISTNTLLKDFGL